MNDLQGAKILIIDDELESVELVKLVFSRAKAQVLTATSGPEGLRKLFAHRPDLVTLDLMMPIMDGYELCQRIRQLSDTPVIVISAMSGHANMIHSLESGADNYVTKPFYPSVLVNRAKALLRRSRLVAPASSHEVYADGFLTINLRRARVFIEGKPINLTTKEYRLLVFFLQNANRAISVRDILENIWGWEYTDNKEFVHVYISRLRTKLEKDSKNPKYLQTVRGVGYRFESQHANNTVR